MERCDAMNTTPPTNDETADKKGLRGEHWSQAARSLLAFAVIGCSLVLYVQQVVRTSWVDAFILNNTLGTRDRKMLLISMIAGAALSVLIPSIYLLWKRTPRAVENLRRLIAQIRVPSSALPVQVPPDSPPIDEQSASAAHESVQPTWPPSVRQTRLAAPASPSRSLQSESVWQYGALHRPFSQA